MKFGPLLGALLATASMAAGAQAPGEYVTAGGWGRLVISGSDPRLSFRIDTLGANGHSCNLSGDLTAGRAVIESSLPNEPACEIDFAPSRLGVQVTPRTTTCRDYCGSRAGFDGEYLAVAASCTSAGRRRTRAAALADYRAGRYAAASERGERLLGNCARTLRADESAAIRNDVAVADFHLGCKEACLRVLAPLLAETTADDLEALRQHAPGDFETWSAIEATTAHNRALCASLP